MPLRSYQQEMLAYTLESVKDSINTAICAPTGIGKSVVIREAVKELTQLGYKVLVVTPTRLLVKNIQKYLPILDVLRLETGYTGDHLIGVYKSTSSRLQAILDWVGDKKLVVISDECHHSAASQWSKIIELTSPAGVIQIGYSATPLRLDGLPLKGYQRCKQFYSIPWYIERGYLSPLEEESLQAPDVEKLLDNLTEQYKIFDNLHPRYLENWQRKGFRADGTARPTLIYGTTIEHCEQIVETYNRAYPGKFAVISVKNKTAEIDKALKAFERGDLWGLANVQLLTEGVDCPSVEVIQLCRATGSVSLLWQMIGRALRPSGDSIATILDHAGNLHRLGSVLTPVNWEYLFNRVAPTSKTQQGTSRRCPACGIGEIGAGIVCSYCGYMNVIKAKRQPKQGDQQMEIYTDSIQRRVLAIRKIKSFRIREIQLKGLIHPGINDQDFNLVVGELAVFGISAEILEDLQDLRK